MNKAEEIKEAIKFATKDLEKAKMLDMSVHTDVKSLEIVLYRASLVDTVIEKLKKDIEKFEHERFKRLQLLVDYKGFKTNKALRDYAEELLKILEV